MNYARVAECRGLAPLARRHAFVSTEARLACPVGIPEMVRRPLLAESQRGGGLQTLLSLGFVRGFWFAVFAEKEGFRKHQQSAKPLGQETVIASAHDGSTFHVSFLLNGPRGRSCTCNLPGLSGTPLLVGLHADGAHGRICTDTLRVLSAPSLRWTTWAKLVPREGFPPPTSPS